MKIIEKNNIKFCIFDIFEPFEQNIISHAFSTRIGGVSTGVYESLNLHFREDTKENVIQNYKIICDAINCQYENVVFSSQIHEDRIYKATKQDRGKGLLRESDIIGYDALITNEPEVILTTFYADCVPVYFLDPIKKAVGIAHSGWRGTVKEIASKTAIKLKQEFDVKLQDLLVGIGPSIGDCCFQVGLDVVKEFEQNLNFSKNFIKEDLQNNKYKINLQNIIKQSLINIGIREKNIEIAGICTKCRQDLFFSHRAMGNERGSLAGIISLKNLGGV